MIEIIIEILETFFNDPSYMYLPDFEYGFKIENIAENIDLEAIWSMNTDPGQGGDPGDKNYGPRNSYGTGFTGNRYNVSNDPYPRGTLGTNNPTSTSNSTGTNNPRSTSFPVNPGTGYAPGAEFRTLFDLINWKNPVYPNSLGYTIGKEFSICPNSNTYIIDDPTNIGSRGYIDPTTGKPYLIQQPYIGNFAAALEHANGNTDQDFNGATVSGVTFRWNEHQYYHAYTEYNAIKDKAPSGEHVKIMNSAIRRLVMKQTRR